MRRIYVFTLLASVISGSAFAQSLQPGFSNSTTVQPYAVQATPAQGSYAVPLPHYITPPPHYVVPPPHYIVPPPHYIVRQAGDPVTTPNTSLHLRRGIRAAVVSSKGFSAARRSRRTSFLRSSRATRRRPMRRPLIRQSTRATRRIISSIRNISCRSFPMTAAKNRARSLSIRPTNSFI
jgi:hypothetical protein